MRIISKFHDYYDTALGYGIDTTQVLVRKQEVIEGKWVKPPSGYQWITPFAVGFCGKWYYGVKYYQPMVDKFIVYDIQDLSEKRKELFQVNPFYDTLDPKLGRIGKWLNGEYKLSEDLFYELKAACLYFEVSNRRDSDQQTITTWPVLKDIDFMRFKDPYTAFQDISMYQFGVIGCQEKDTVNISDKDRLVGKGFDLVYGFRKRK